MEQWKDIENYEGLYQISSFGRIKSLSRPHNFRGIRKERILKSIIGKTGYKHIFLCKNSKAKIYKIHRLVAKHFIDNPNNYPDINHINGIKLNNLIDNLEWCTKSQNTKHSFKIGLQDNKGEKNPQNKLTLQQVQEIRKLLNKKNNTQKEIAAIYNINQRTVSNIKTGHRWKEM